MKNIHFFPKTIKQVVNGKIVDVDFNIEQLIPEFLVNEFGMENIINAIDELKITYSDLTSISECSSNHFDFYLNKWHDIFRSELIEKRDRYGAIIDKYYKYSFYQFSFVSKGSKLLSKLIIEKYPYLNEIRTTEIVSFDPYKFINGYDNLNDIPNEFRDHTINELMLMVGIQEKEIETSLCKIYTSGLSNFDTFEFYLECPDFECKINCLYIPYKALKENNYSIIHERTESYIKSYIELVKKDATNDLKILNCDTALKLKKLMS